MPGVTIRFYALTKALNIAFMPLIVLYCIVSYRIVSHCIIFIDCILHSASGNSATDELRLVSCVINALWRYHLHIRRRSNSAV